MFYHSINVRRGKPCSPDFLSLDSTVNFSSFLLHNFSYLSWCLNIWISFLKGWERDVEGCFPVLIRDPVRKVFLDRFCIWNCDISGFSRLTLSTDTFKTFFHLILLTFIQLATHYGFDILEKAICAFITVGFMRCSKARVEAIIFFTLRKIKFLWIKERSEDRLQL